MIPSRNLISVRGRTLSHEYVFLVLYAFHGRPTLSICLSWFSAFKGGIDRLKVQTKLICPTHHCQEVLKKVSKVGVMTLNGGCSIRHERKKVVALFVISLAENLSS